LGREFATWLHVTKFVLLRIASIFHAFPKGLYNLLQIEPAKNQQPDVVRSVLGFGARFDPAPLMQAPSVSQPKRSPRDVAIPQLTGTPEFTQKMRRPSIPASEISSSICDSDHGIRKNHRPLECHRMRAAG
jgi:hypothetical protein